MAQRTATKQDVAKYARSYVSYLRTAHGLPVTQAYLFGSHAKKTPHADSDIDVCILSPSFSHIEPLTYLWTRRRTRDVARRIEPYGMTPRDFRPENPIAHEVQAHGIPLMKQ